MSVCRVDVGLLSYGLGLATANATEWVVHKYVLHGLGKKKDSFFAFHWRDHHNACRKLNFYDPDYEQNPFSNTSQGKELFLIIGTVAAALPASAVSWSYYAGIVTGAGVYYVVHRKAHLDPEWAKKWLPWHVQHHMGRNQDQNWAVTFPLSDWIMGTATPYLVAKRLLHICL